MKTAEQTTVGDANKLLDGRLVDQMPTPAPGGAPLPSGDNAVPPPTGAPTSGAKLKVDAKWDAYRDNFGKPFNPVLHEHEAKDGKAIPRISGKGRLMFKRGNNQKAKAASVLGADEPAQAGAAGAAVGPDGAPPLPPGAELKAAALMTVAAVTGATAMIMGKQWKPTDGELEALTAATEAYMIESGATGMSPKGALAMLAVGFVVSRLDHPDTQKRLAGFKVKLAYMWGKFRGRTDPVGPSEPASASVPASPPVPA